MEKRYTGKQYYTIECNNFGSPRMLGNMIITLDSLENLHRSKSFLYHAELRGASFVTVGLSKDKETFTVSFWSPHDGVIDGIPDNQENMYKTTLTYKLIPMKFL